jgi:DNA gyrase subunit A
MVVADPDATLLTVCQNGYGKRTPFGPNSPIVESEDAAGADEVEETTAPETSEEEDEGSSSSARYPTKNRGTMGVRDIKTTERNGPVVCIVSVNDDDELIMMTARGKLQRMAVAEISVIGRNTQGVKIMSLDEGDTLAGVVRVPREPDEGPTQSSETETIAPPSAGPAQPDVSEPEADETESDEGQ